MAEPQLKKKVILIGRLETPMISSKPFVKKGDFWIKVVVDPEGNKKPLFTTVGKLVKGEQKAPTILRAYRGFVKVSCVGYNEEQLLVKISSFMINRFIGGHSSEGFGRVKWLECKVENYTSYIASHRKKFKIRKGLGVNYPTELHQLLIALMLHDFVHTEKHQSKIYQQITIEDEEIRDACLNHHNGEESNNKLLPLVKYYDRLASYICRKKPFKVISRYNWEKGEIDFNQMKQELEFFQSSAYKLYNYIYHSKELERVIESMIYGRNKLRNHLLVMVNLAINDFYNQKLLIKNGEIIIKRNNYKQKISTSASERAELDTATDAEMHSLLTMSNADSERATTSKKRRLGT